MDYNISWEEICKLKNSKQEEAINNLKKNGFRGTCEWFTGSGKTTIAIKALTRAKNNNNNNIITHVIVPKLNIKKQWEKELVINNLQHNTFVFVINSYVVNKNNCDLLIIDEIHRTGAESFSKIFKNTEYKWVLGLTAFLKRKDGKNKYIEKFCPICHRFTLKEGIELNLLPRFKVFNLNINLPEDLDRQYKDYTKNFEKLFAYFQHDFNSMKSCLNYLNSLNYVRNLDINSLGDLTLENSDEKSIAKKLQKYASLATFYMRKREELIQKNELKLEIAAQILLNVNNKRAFTFDEFIENTEKLKVLLNEGSKKFICDSYSSENSDKRNEAILTDFNNNFIRYLASAKSLIEGVNIPFLDLAIAINYNSSESDFIQSFGRGARLDKNNLNKIFVYINIVTLNTVEERWNNQRTQSIKNITNTSNVKEIIDFINNN